MDIVLPPDDDGISFGVRAKAVEVLPQDDHGLSFGIGAKAVKRTLVKPKQASSSSAGKTLRNLPSGVDLPPDVTTCTVLPMPSHPDRDARVMDTRKKRHAFCKAAPRLAPFSGCMCQKEHTYPHDAVFEVFSPPRLVTEAVRRGLKASVSLDVKTGWDASLSSEKQRARTLLGLHKPWMLMACPECTMYSIIQRNCNIPKMNPEVVKERLAVADDHLNFGLDMCLEQGLAGRKFIFEHPGGASSWQSPGVGRVLQQIPEARIIGFCQCRFGLVAPDGQPMQKVTRFLTNSAAIIQIFSGCNCICKLLGRSHVKIEGSMNGYSLSRWAQCYPPMMVSAILDGVQQEMP
ncbi:unnamed protein product [Durusdinium trenchii]|uniref:Uncharacterized protein n=2 Tax=Durusdinium trenchii TaxID=1381693 RepID=A0ABP0R0V6_9DINO